jgi:nicotinate-nucleotide adenylyltransferase
MAQNNDKKQKRIGIWGGSFNPPTYAHAELASYVADKAGLDRLHWLVCPHNPLKDEMTLAPFYHRMAMVGQVIADKPRMIADDTEQRLGRSWTATTLKHLRTTQFPDDALFFVMGGDNWQQFHLWGDDRADNFDFASFIILRRPGFEGLEACLSSMEFGARQVANISELKPSGTWCILDNPVFDMSATEVRASLQQGKRSPFIAPETQAYIEANGLYGVK